MSLLRRLLGLTYEDATIIAHQFTAPIVEGPGRDGPPPEEKLTQSTQVDAALTSGNPVLTTPQAWAR